jgi:WD40 repeat protein
MRPGARWHNGLSDVVTGRGALLALAAGRHRVVAGGHDGTVRLFDADTGKLVWTKNVSSVPVCSLALDGGESQALVGLWDGTVRLVELPQGRISDLPRGHRDCVGCVAFLGADRAVTASSDGTVRVWQREGETFREWLSLPGRAPVAGMSATADGRCLALVLAGERAVRVWHLDRLQQRLRELGME